MKFTSYIPSLRRTMRCSLWRSTFFLTVRTSGYRKTDCIRVNCDVYGNNRRGEADPPHFFQEFQTCCDMFYHVFLYIYRMCGYVVFKLRNFIKCENCYLKLQNNSDLTFILFICFCSYFRLIALKVRPYRYAIIISEINSIKWISPRENNTISFWKGSNFSYRI